MLRIGNNWGIKEFFWTENGVEHKLAAIHAVEIKWPNFEKPLWYRAIPHEHCETISDHGHQSEARSTDYTIPLDCYGTLLMIPIKQLVEVIVNIEVTVPIPPEEIVKEKKVRMARTEAKLPSQSQFDGSIGGDGRTPQNSGMTGPDAANW